MSERETQVWVVEPDAVTRAATVALIERQPGMRCPLAAGSCEEALAAIRAGALPDVVLMDLELPGMGGREGLRRIAGAAPAAHIIVLTLHDEDEHVFEALCAGAVGYLLKPSSDARIVEAVETALRGGAPMNAFIARQVLRMFTRQLSPRTDYGLTERETQILQLLLEAQSQKQIARMLGLSTHTVDTHVRKIYVKLQVNSRAAAVAKAVQERLV